MGKSGYIVTSTKGIAEKHVGDFHGNVRWWGDLGQTEMLAFSHLAGPQVRWLAAETLGHIFLNEPHPDYPDSWPDWARGLKTKMTPRYAAIVRIPDANPTDIAHMIHAVQNGRMVLEAAFVRSESGLHHEAMLEIGDNVLREDVLDLGISIAEYFLDRPVQVLRIERDQRLEPIFQSGLVSV